MKILVLALLLLLLPAQSVCSYSTITDFNLFYSFFTQPNKIIDFSKLKDGTLFARDSHNLEQNIAFIAKPDCLGPQKREQRLKKTTVQPNAFSDEWSFLVASSDRSEELCRAVLWFDQGISSGHNKIVVMAASGKSKPFVLYTNKGFIGIVPDSAKETIFIFNGFSVVFSFETDFHRASTVSDPEEAYVAKVVSDKF